jgi:hypothetical protein
MQEAKVKREEKYVYLTSLGNAIDTEVVKTQWKQEDGIYWVKYRYEWLYVYEFVGTKTGKTLWY